MTDPDPYRVIYLPPRTPLVITTHVADPDIVGAYNVHAWVYDDHGQPVTDATVTFTTISPNGDTTTPSVAQAGDQHHHYYAGLPALTEGRWHMQVQATRGVARAITIASLYVRQALELSPHDPQCARFWCTGANIHLAVFRGRGERRCL